MMVSMCGHKSTLELLVGQLQSHDSQSSSHERHVTSPYVSMATRAETTTELRSTHEAARGGCDSVEEGEETQGEGEGEKRR